MSESYYVETTLDPFTDIEILCKQAVIFEFALLCRYQIGLQDLLKYILTVATMPV